LKSIRLNSFNVYKHKLEKIKSKRHESEDENEKYNSAEETLEINKNVLTKQSKSANYFFNKLLEFLPKEYTYNWGKNEIFIRDKNKMYFYDFECKELKKIIEFNGDYWHANPKFYEKNETIRDISCTDIWNKDLIKINVAKSKGYQILIVWEKEVKDNIENIIKECVKFITS
jgi:very-short-patch-repair endonuclease